MTVETAPAPVQPPEDMALMGAQLEAEWAALNGGLPVGAQPVAETAPADHAIIGGDPEKSWPLLYGTASPVETTPPSDMALIGNQLQSDWSARHLTDPLDGPAFAAPVAEVAPEQSYNFWFTPAADRAPAAVGRASVPVAVPRLYSGHEPVRITNMGVPGSERTVNGSGASNLEATDVERSGVASTPAEGVLYADSELATPATEPLPRRTPRAPFVPESAHVNPLPHRGIGMPRTQADFLRDQGIEVPADIQLESDAQKLAYALQERARKEAGYITLGDLADVQERVEIAETADVAAANLAISEAKLAKAEARRQSREKYRVAGRALGRFAVHAVVAMGEAMAPQIAYWASEATSQPVAPAEGQPTEAESSETPAGTRARSSQVASHRSNRRTRPAAHQPAPAAVAPTRRRHGHRR